MTRNRALSAGLTVAVASHLVLFSGCRSENDVTPIERQARLLAAQNVELKQSLLDVQAENDKIREHCAAQLENKDKELAKSEARNKRLQKELEEGIAERVTGVMVAVMEENARLRKASGELKTQMEALQAQIEQLQAEVERLSPEDPPPEPEPSDTP